MADKKIVLILNTSQEYTRHIGEDGKCNFPVMNAFYESITDIYIPLIKMFHKLESEHIPFKLGLVLTPSLCALLEDVDVQNEYISWLDNRIELGKKELERCKNSADLLNAVKLCLEKHQEAKNAYESIGRKIIKKFNEYAKKGYVEFLATCATDIFFPHYHDMEEIKNAQIETGLLSYKYFFGHHPEGFWLPDLGYYPGIEENLKNYNIGYTILDARSFLFGEQLPAKGIFQPVRVGNCVIAFGKNPYTDEEIFGREGYSSDSVYLDSGRDIGFELDEENLGEFFEEGKARHSFGYCYWNKGGRNSDENYVNPDCSENVYNYEEALKKCSEHAASFVEKRVSLLQSAMDEIGGDTDISLTETINISRLQEKWSESVLWIENIFRFANEKNLSFANPKDLISEQFKFQRVYPYYGAGCDDGYGEGLLSKKNSWMIRYVRKASERMVDLSERFTGDTGLKARLLNLGSKELLLAESSGWARMIENDVFPEYAKSRFIQSINDFTAVFDALGSNTVSTEWLTRLEEEHKIFPWMNYRIFSRKK